MTAATKNQESITSLSLRRQATRRLQLKRLARRYSSVREVVEERDELRAEIAKLKAPKKPAPKKR